MRQVERDGGVVYIPARAIRGERADLSLYRLADGRLAAPAYTTLEALVRCCGSAQQWVAFDTDGLDEAKTRCGIDVFLLDAVMPAALQQHRRVEDDDVETYRPDSWLRDPRERSKGRRS